MEALWVVYLRDEGYEGDSDILGVVDSLEKFKEYAVSKGITSDPIEDYFGRGSLHYEYSVKKSEKYSEYYSLVAEPFYKINL
jgi:hypothetical protein